MILAFCDFCFQLNFIFFFINCTFILTSWDLSKVLVSGIWLKTCMIIKSQHTLYKSLLELQEKKWFQKTCILLFSLISKHASYAQWVNEGINQRNVIAGNTHRYCVFIFLAFSAFNNSHITFVRFSPSLPANQ